MSGNSGGTEGRGRCGMRRAEVSLWRECNKWWIFTTVINTGCKYCQQVKASVGHIYIYLVSGTQHNIRLQRK